MASDPIRTDDPVDRLHRDDLPVDTVELARFLVGKALVHDLPEGRAAGRIVETEGYPVGDAAGHAFRGETQRNRSLFLAHGHAYVYFSYGCWYCFNVASEARGIGGGVLVRALEPLTGEDLMARRRGTTRRLDLARGPGRLATALGIDRRCDGVDLCGDGPLWLARIARPTAQVGTSPRIGISREVERPLRFYEIGNPFVSGPRRLRESNGHASS